MNKSSIFIFLNLIFVVVLGSQFISHAAIAGGKWKQVPADETRIVLKGWPEEDRFKYYKGWHSDNWAMECEQANNYQGGYKTMIRVCIMFPGFRYNPGAGPSNYKDYGYWKWKIWQGSEINPGQDTNIKNEDPRIFRHINFTQYGSKCQFMLHVREAGNSGNDEGADRHEFRPMITIMTCNSENLLKENNFRIDDANEKVVVSYPGKEQQYTKSSRTGTKSSSDVLSSLFKKDKIPLHSKNIYLKEKCNDRYEEKVVTGVHTSLAYWLGEYSGTYQCASGYGFMANLAVCSEKASERAKTPVKCKIYAIHEHSSGNTYIGKEEILEKFAPDKLMVSTTKSEKYKPTTNFTSSDTKTSVVSNTDTRSVPFAAHWESKSGILLGVLNYPKRDTSGSLSASSGDISCRGTWQRAGQGAKNGTWSIACSDGRTASGFYKVKEAGKGAGTGTDPDGNKVEITWGG